MAACSNCTVHSIRANMKRGAFYMTDLETLYSRALEVGITPPQFWNMSIKEAVDVINSRFKQRQDELYSLSGLIRVAVASVLNSENKFPQSAREAFGRVEDEEEGWQRSKEYMSALAAIHNRKGA